MTQSPMTIVTLTFNNLSEARKAMASVALQTTRPHSYLVVDSSDESVAQDVERLAVHAGADYRWVPPRGVYPAMNEAIRLIPHEHFVWFINSSDWLSGPRSVESVAEALEKDVSWLIGGVERHGDAATPQHPLPESPTDFVRLLAAGKTGFPHPAAIMSRGLIEKLGMFDESYLIAGDYDLALRFSRTVGPPLIIPRILSVHVPTGLTSRHRVRHAWEKMNARRKDARHFRWGTEIATQIRQGLGAVGVQPPWKKSFSDFPRGEAFGEELNSWPETLQPQERP